jgi:hypothetical protein
LPNFGANGLAEGCQNKSAAIAAMLHVELPEDIRVQGFGSVNFALTSSARIMCRFEG